MKDEQLRVLPLDGLCSLIAKLERTVAALIEAKGEAGHLIAASYRHALDAAPQRAGPPHRHRSLTTYPHHQIKGKSMTENEAAYAALVEWLSGKRSVETAATLCSMPVCILRDGVMQNTFFGSLQLAELGQLQEADCAIDNSRWMH